MRRMNLAASGKRIYVKTPRSSFESVSITEMRTLPNWSAAGGTNTNVDIEAVIGASREGRQTARLRVEPQLARVEASASQSGLRTPVVTLQATYTLLTRSELSTIVVYVLAGHHEMSNFYDLPRLLLRFQLLFRNPKST